MRSGSAVIALALVWACSDAKAAVRVEGATRVWHTVTLTFDGPEAAETDSAPNPFLDYRLQVTFHAPSGKTYRVPGFFDGDGAGGVRGRAWRVRFTPDEPGAWRYEASFRRGAGVAIVLEPDAGAAADFDGASGSLTIAPRDAAAPGFARWGRLEYVGGHYLKFRDGGYWLRGGTDEPENFLAYAGFDDTTPSHTYAAHAADWNPGDPDWGGGRGKAIIGALNYLASRGTNNLYFLPMNIGGDGKDVWPFVGSPDPKGSPSNDNLHYDVSKLAQWEIVFAHAQKVGLFLHVVLNEAENGNKRELDDSELGPERKLYYREMIARFGHHLAMQWNLCEEYNLGYDIGHDRVRQYADYVRAIDPYEHPVTVHSAGDPLAALRFTFGDARFSMTSLQTGARRVDTVAEAFRAESAAAGRPLPVSLDEFTVKGELRCGPPETLAICRQSKIWPTYLSGGMVEIILNDLLEVDDFRSNGLEALWDATLYARRFVEALPFHEMAPMDELIEGAGTITVQGSPTGGRDESQLGAQVFARADTVYAVYFPTAAQTGRLNLAGASGDFDVRWYNPRTGEFVGPSTSVSGGRAIALGPPPQDPSLDWAVLLRKATAPPPVTR